MKKFYFVLFVSLMLVGCGGKETDEQSHAGHSHGSHSMDKTGAKSAVMDYSPASDEIGKEAVCPVMKNKFKINKNTDAAMYKGKKYFFCCAGCGPAFKKNPGKYVK